MSNYNESILSGQNVTVVDVISYPAKTIAVIESDDPIELPLNTPFASPRQTRNHGELWCNYYLGTDADYLERTGRDPSGSSHEVWVNSVTVSLTSHKRPHKHCWACARGAASFIAGRSTASSPHPTTTCRQCPADYSGARDGATNQEATP